MAMNQHIQQPAQRGDRVAARTGAASLARRQVLLQRRHQEAVATARAVCHRSQLLLARQRVRRQRRQGQQVEPLAWFAVQGVIDQQVVRAVWSGARTDRPTLARLLDQLRPGDTLVVWKPDRLGRSLRHLVDTITLLGDRGVGFRSLVARSVAPPAGRSARLRACSRC